MLWNNAFHVGNDHYSIRAEFAPHNGSDSVGLLFSVTRDNGSQGFATWKIELRVSGQDASQIKQSENLASWIWNQGYAIIQRTANAGHLKEGTFLLRPLYLSEFKNTTLDDLA